MKPDNNDASRRWSPEELRGAEAAASRFFEDNCAQIADTMRAKTKFLETLIQRLSWRRTTFEDRLEYFARVSEVARLIADDADGFFQLASQPVVARILGSVAPEKSAGE